QRPAPSVVERVRLLLHDVGALARRAHDQAGVLDGGCVDPPVAVEATHLFHRCHNAATQGLRRGKDVRHPARRLELRAQALSSARYGFRSRSAPSVVAGPCPGYTVVSGGKRSVRIRADSISVSQSPPARSTRPTELAKMRSPEKRQPSA